MGEIRRLINKKIILLILLAVVVLLLLYSKDQSALLVYKDAESGEVVEITQMEAYTAYGELINFIEAEEIDDSSFAERYDQIKTSFCDDEMASAWAVNKYSTMIRLKNDYSMMTKDIVDHADDQEQISIFKKGGDSTERNREKTKTDYDKATEIRWEIKNTWAIESVLEEDYAAYIIVALCLIMIWQLNAEKKYGLSLILHQASGGRAKLSFKRFFIILGMSLGTGILLYGILFLRAFTIYGGFDAFFEPMQLVERWYRLPYHLTVLQATLLHIMSVSAAAAVFACILWCCITMFENSMLSLVVFGSISAVMFVMYTSIRDTSQMGLLRQLNVFSLLYPERWIGQYYNIDIFNKAASRYAVLSCFALLSVFVAGITAVVLSVKKYPIKKNSAITKFIAGLNVFWKKKVSRIPFRGYEIKKILIYQRIWIVLILLFFVCKGEKRISGVRYDETDGDYLKEIYEEYTGPVDDGIYNYVKNAKAEIEDHREEMARLEEVYENGELTYNQYLNRYLYREDCIRLLNRKIGAVESQLGYLEEIKEDRQIEGWFLDERGFNALMGKANYGSQNMLGILSIIASVLIGISVFAYEKRSNMQMILRTAGGRRKQIVKKYLSAGALVIIVWVMVYGYNLYNMITVYEINNIDAPIQSMRIMEDFPLKILIGTYFVFLYGMRLIIMLSLFTLFAFLSYKLSSRICLLIGVLALLPHILYLLGVDAVGPFSLVRYLAYIQNWNLYGNTIWLWLAGIIILLSGITSCIFVIKEN